MPRAARVAPAGVIFHVINRGVGRGEIFAKDELMVARYIERNALRAGLAPFAGPACGGASAAVAMNISRRCRWRSGRWSSRGIGSSG